MTKSASLEENVQRPLIKRRALSENPPTQKTTRGSVRTDDSKKRKPLTETIDQSVLCEDKANNEIKNRTEEVTESGSSSVSAQQVNDVKVTFEAKYREAQPLGEGGGGSVFAGYRTSDHLPVAIKHVPKHVARQLVHKNGTRIPIEVAIMLYLKQVSGDSVAAAAPVSLLDWYQLDQEVILVLERPVPCEDLFTHMELRALPLEEKEAKVIMKQLVDAVIDLLDKGVFHGDLKFENILIETGSQIPRVRIIDFGLSNFCKTDSVYLRFYGTAVYAPPEFFAKSCYRPGPTTAWQLGAVMFEMLHFIPFETKSYVGFKLKINSELSQSCQDFFKLCLAEEELRPNLKELQNHPWLS